MRLSELESRRLLPSSIADDAFDVSMTVGFDEAARRTYEASRLLTIWDKIDLLPEPVLDELADALHIEWYDAGAALDTKRALIRTSDLVHAKKGTVAAVETVIRAYFGEGRIMEWPEYAGEPHHFKVFTTEPSLVGENLTRFLDRLRRVKRHSSKLDSILIGLTGEEWLYMGDGNRDFAHEIHAAAKDEAYLFMGAVSAEHEALTLTVIPEGIVSGDIVAVLLTGHAQIEHGSDLVRIAPERDPFEGDLTSHLLHAAAVIQRETVRVRITSGGRLWEPSSTTP